MPRLSHAVIAARAVSQDQDRAIAIARAPAPPPPAAHPPLAAAAPPPPVRAAATPPQQLAREDSGEWPGLDEAMRHSLDAGQTSIPLSSVGAAVAVSFDEIRVQTASFSTIIREGGFGKVYRAPSMPSLTWSGACAIKVLNPDSQQGATEFDNELRLLAMYRHVNLLPLLGFCREQERCLIYPLMPGGNLEDRLLHTEEGRRRLASLGMDRAPPPLQWRDRLRIVRDATRALCHLHDQDPPVLHRDIKPANILLDEQLHTRLSDVGIARQAQQLRERTHLSTTSVVGTNGFIDPLYTQTGQYSQTTDGYAMGVKLLMCLVQCPAILVMDQDRALPMLENPERAPQFVSQDCNWPAEVAIAATKVAKGLVWARSAQQRLSVRDALRELETLIDSASSPTSTAAAQNTRECMICMSAPRSTRLACGHATMCETCAAQATICPICRASLQIVHRGNHIATEGTFIQQRAAPVPDIAALPSIAEQEEEILQRTLRISLTQQ